MPRSLFLGNGNLLVGLDHLGQVRDFYFPHVGLENQLGGDLSHRIGLYLDGEFSWLTDPRWQTTIDYEKETMASAITAKNQRLKLELRFLDAVYNERDIFLRQVTVKNLAERSRPAKIFFHQQFQIYEIGKGNTAYFDPDHEAIIHYKGQRVFLITGRSRNKSFDDYSVGLFQAEGREGTWRDAEDGRLSQNPVEHGSVDSVIGFTLSLEPGQSQKINYWIAAAKTIKEAKALQHYVIDKSPEHLLETTQNFWRAWVNKRNFSFYGLSPKVAGLFKKSLLIIRSHVDQNGSIIASGDSAMLQYGRDTYGYMWPRDAAFTALALARAGYFDLAKKFFELCNELITDEGYLLHKYHPDKSPGSSWHPWVKNGQKQLAIQEDETALVLYALYEHYLLSRDLEFVESIYNSLIKKAAEFIAGYRDPKTKLPLGSYDLWEEKFGTATFTAAAAFGALRAAAGFARLLGKEKDEKKYGRAAEEIQLAIKKYLVDRKNNFFYRLVSMEGGRIIPDRTLDISSFYGVFRFGVLEPGAPELTAAAALAEKKLCCQTPIGGVSRYEGDRYYQVSSEIPGNPWIVTTLWLTQYYIAQAKKETDLATAKKWLNWVADRALPSGILSEQLNPYTGEQISAAPLSWSHGEFINTIIQYLEKLEELGICKVCNPVK